MLYDFGELFRNGGATSLNINTVGYVHSCSCSVHGDLMHPSFTYDNRLFGFSLTPNYYELQPQWDGVFVRFLGLPGSPYSAARMGLTAVHEIGHWLGLYHTFEVGCFFQLPSGHAYVLLLRADVAA